MKVYKITIEQAEELRGKEYKEGMIFNPCQDADGVWYISVEEYPFCGFSDLELIDYKPIKITF